MGCFDSVRVPCPKCGKVHEFQSKGGDCRLRVYELWDAPAAVMADVNRHAPYECTVCNTLYMVEDRNHVRYISVAVEEEPHDYP